MDLRHDLHISHPDVAFSFLGQNASFNFLAVVETANVPLYLVAGPSLDVWTDNERTEQWLKQCLFDGLNDNDTQGSSPWWNTHGRQSDDGILLSVHGSGNADGGTKPDITEILIYAAAANTSQDFHALPTPPASSSPGHNSQDQGSLLNIRLYALPLSSTIYKTLDQAPTIPEFDPASNESYYLPSPPDALSHHNDLPPAKRPKIDTLFDEATQIRRLHKKQGGEGIAKAMAAMDARMSMPALSSSSTFSEPSKDPKPRSRTPFSRASTTGCLNSLQMNSSTSRPPSFHLSTLPKGHRSSLSRGTSVLSPSVDESPSSEIPDNDIEQQNKASLSRIVMAGMRMYGLQQQHQRRKSVGAFDSQSQASSTGAGVKTNDDEYKAIYHQTFKATSFAFRNQWKTSVLDQESLRDTVDAFLTRFCAVPAIDQGVGHGFGNV
ncbi:MAG: hypothetical protein Q9221_006635 [Calogaya cf. arnoldii]